MNHRLVVPGRRKTFHNLATHYTVFQSELSSKFVFSDRWQNIGQHSNTFHLQIELAQNCTICSWWIIDWRQRIPKLFGKTLQHQSVSDKTPLPSKTLQAGLCQGVRGRTDSRRAWQHVTFVQIELCCRQKCTIVPQWIISWQDQGQNPFTIRPVFINVEITFALFVMCINQGKLYAGT